MNMQYFLMPVTSQFRLRVICYLFNKIMIFVIYSHFMERAVWFQFDVCQARMRFFRQGMLAVNTFQYFHASYFTNCFVTVCDIVAACKSSSSAHYLTTFLEER